MDLNQNISPYSFLNTHDTENMLKQFHELHQREVKEKVRPWLQHRLIVVSDEDGDWIDFKQLNIFEKIGSFFKGRASLKKIFEVCSKKGVSKDQYSFLKTRLFRFIIKNVPNESELDKKRELVYKPLTLWERIVGLCTGSTSEKMIAKFLVEENKLKPNPELESKKPKSKNSNDLNVIANKLKGAFVSFSPVIVAEISTQESEEAKQQADFQKISQSRYFTKKALGFNTARIHDLPSLQAALKISIRELVGIGEEDEGTFDKFDNNGEPNLWDYTNIQCEARDIVDCDLYEIRGNKTVDCEQGMRRVIQARSLLEEFAVNKPGIEPELKNKSLFLLYAEAFLNKQIKEIDEENITYPARESIQKLLDQIKSRLPDDLDKSEAASFLDEIKKVSQQNEILTAWFKEIETIKNRL